ncbi:MAG: hypothetical protein DYH17_06370 [Xanthomonadales bacterium PRO6]|nr:hypothetical protein [Xanthomonadales bacterium]MCE7930981.1 hypothetical protein [Xanthomonadales bacterium PRO6]
MPAVCFGHALFLSQTGEHARAWEEIQLAVLQEPLLLPLKRWQGAVLYNARRYPEAIAQFERLLDAGDDPFAVSGMLVRAYVLSGRDADMQAFLASLRPKVSQRDFAGLDLAEAWHLARRGETGKARALVEHVRQLQFPDWGRDYLRLQEAVARQALGDREGVRACLLEVAAADWDPPKFLNVSPEFDELRGYPEFQALVRRTGLEPAPAL